MGKEQWDEGGKRDKKKKEKKEKEKKKKKKKRKSNQRYLLYMKSKTESRAHTKECYGYDAKIESHHPKPLIPWRGRERRLWNQIRDKNRSYC